MTEFFSQGTKESILTRKEWETTGIKLILKLEPTGGL